MAIAYVLDPLCDRVERWGCSRTWATTIVVIGVAVVVALLLLLVVPLLYVQIVELVERLPGLPAPDRGAGDAADRAAGRALLPLPATRTPSRPSRARAPTCCVWQAAPSRRSSAAAWRWSACCRSSSSCRSWPFYLLRDWDARGADRLLAAARPRRTIRDLARQIDRTLAGFVRGQSLVCLVLALLRASR